MIKTTKNTKILQKNEKVTVKMDGRTMDLVDEYLAITKCIAKTLVDSCVPGKLEQMKGEFCAEIFRIIGKSFAEAEKDKDEKGEVWRRA
nr:hypothetical protein [uncultured Mogibacterium sp.]